MAQVPVEYSTGPGTLTPYPVPVGQQTVVKPPKVTVSTATQNPGASNAPSVSAATTQPSSQPSSQQAKGNPYDYSGDPILMQAKAFASSANQQAQAQADARLKQLGLEYNDPSNPFSTVARLDRQYADNLTNTNEAYNKQNLWYSGHRGKALGDLATALQQSKYDAANQYRAQTTDVANQLAQALLGNQQNLISAEGDAYGRALQQALAYGIDPGAKDTPDPATAGTVSSPTGTPSQALAAASAAIGQLPPNQAAELAPMPGAGFGTTYPITVQAPAAKPTAMTITGNAGAGAGAKTAPVLAQGPARYYTTKAQAEAAAKPGQTVKFTAGRGYYVA